jgi:hypothetical protein
MKYSPYAFPKKQRELVENYGTYQDDESVNAKVFNYDSKDGLSYFDSKFAREDIGVPSVSIPNLEHSITQANSVLFDKYIHDFHKNMK